MLGHRLAAAPPARRSMPGAEVFRHRPEVGHRYRVTSVPRPDARFPGAVEVRVPAYGIERMPSLRWADADPANPADRAVAPTLEHEGRDTRLFLVHEGFDPDDPARMTERPIMGRDRRGHVLPAPGHVLDRLG
ncbi:SRPBCC domain-containing protein [Streptomyces sp. NPDC013455]|uniref:SRPBCC domain-containing protein n=1 Tax=Streptomyces sp. NPDC013455 TaxID=3155605 RepID=UPI0033D50B0E